MAILFINKPEIGQHPQRGYKADSCENITSIVDKDSEHRVRIVKVCFGLDH